MPMGSEQNDPTNLPGWEPWLQAILGWGEGVFFHSAPGPPAAGRLESEEACRPWAAFTASCYMRASGVVAVLEIPAENGKVNPTPA